MMKKQFLEQILMIRYSISTVRLFNGIEIKDLIGSSKKDLIVLAKIFLIRITKGQKGLKVKSV
jgi:hypothetical protein